MMKKLTLSLLVLVLLLSGVKSVSAAILNPYVVDEKPQVLFGDSTPVSIYFGLENYAQDYVSGYAHLTFTYTHHRCCFASYPPSLYITSFDPRATTTPVVKDLYPAYHLPSMMSDPSTKTDWYLYDIQFDATGYTVVVTQATTTQIVNAHRDIPGLTNNDWVSLANLHPVQDPIFDQSYSMAFTPVPIQDTVLPPIPSRIPVIIVPGIVSSYLNRIDLIVDNERWPNLLLMSLSPDDFYLNDLLLTSGGNTIQNISPTNILVNIGDFDFFSGLINQLSVNQEVVSFPYDWRLDVQLSAARLRDKIDQIKSEVGTDKVDIIAHSMGGLLVKKYLKDYGGDSVNKFVDVA